MGSHSAVTERPKKEQIQVTTGEYGTSGTSGRRDLVRSDTVPLPTGPGTPPPGYGVGRPLCRGEPSVLVSLRPDTKGSCSKLKSLEDLRFVYKEDKGRTTPLPLRRRLRPGPKRKTEGPRVSSHFCTRGGGPPDPDEVDTSPVPPTQTTSATLLKNEKTTELPHPSPQVASGHGPPAPSNESRTLLRRGVLSRHSNRGSMIPLSRPF